MFQQGQGMPINHAEAAEWYRKAAEQGYAEAQHELGMQYAEGRGVFRDNVLAYMWLSLSGTAAKTSADVDRATVIKRMSKRQIETAEQLVREWKPTSP
jgi:TPR repeat protein